MSDTMTEGVIAVWHKKVGDTVRSGDILADVETDKATMELENFVNGVLLHVGVPQGSSVPVDAIIAIVGKEGEDISGLLSSDQKTETADKNKQPEPSSMVDGASLATANAPISGTDNATPAQPTGSHGIGRTKASPLARKMAEERGIDLKSIQGSGDGGRIVRRDLESLTHGSGAATSAATPTPTTEGQESFELVSISPMRKTIARRLAESKFTAPHFYLNMEVDMGRAVDSRARLNEVSGTKISFNDLVVKAVAMALPHHPAVNASWLGDSIRYNKHVHLGVAMAVEDGLLVPVVRFANQKSLSQIAQETASLAERARQKKLQPSDWEGNTFTISNLGMFGIESFTAIINPPDACILAVGAIRQHLLPYPPSSPAIALFKNGQLVHYIERHMIEGRSAQMIAQNLIGAFEQHCN